MKQNYKLVKSACYTTNVCMAVICNIPPLLFLTFRDLYGISYSLLGTLVFISFGIQLVIDLIFWFFSHKFNIPLTVKLTPLLGAVGMAVYALWPVFFPSLAYMGLIVGTLIFSTSCGLAEVLISPTIATIPSDDPDREMSKLHAVFAWGSVAVIILSSFFLLLFGNQNWHLLLLLFTVIPLCASALFFRSTLPPMNTPEKFSGAVSLFKNKQLWLCSFLIFMGGATECTMSQWCSGYLENALAIPKIWGDIFGASLFSVFLGLGRSLYAKRGNDILCFLRWGAVGAVVCYFLCAVTTYPPLGLLACAFTGFCASMMWPGSLIVAADRLPTGGVFLYAMMAAGGDLGASVGPQLVGVITDTAATIPALTNIAVSLGLAPTQVGMKLGMLIGTLFPVGVLLLLTHFRRSQNRA